VKHMILGLAAAMALSGAAFAQTGSADSSGTNASTTNTQRTDDTHHDYGWIGLLGLAGLAGLRKQNHDRTVDTTTGTRR